MPTYFPTTLNINVHKFHDLNTWSQILKEYLLTMLLDTVSVSLENGNGSAVDERKTIKRSQIPEIVENRTLGNLHTEYWTRVTRAMWLSYLDV
jgi:hypothetical protein